MSAKELFVNAVEGIIATFQGNANAKAKYQEWVGTADKVKAKFERLGINAAFAAIGVEATVEGGINEKSVTEAINQSLLGGSGVVLTNIFDSDSVKRDLIKFALDKAAAAMGDDLRFTSLDVDSVTKELKGYVRGRIVSELQARGGDLIDGAPDNALVLKLIEHYEKSISTPLVDTVEAEGNRRRQATYRAAHHRHWEGH